MTACPMRSSLPAQRVQRSGSIHVPGKFMLHSTIHLTSENLQDNDHN